MPVTDCTVIAVASDILCCIWTLDIDEIRIHQSERLNLLAWTQQICIANLFCNYGKEVVWIFCWSTLIRKCWDTRQNPVRPPSRMTWYKLKGQRCELRDASVIRANFRVFALTATKSFRRITLLWPTAMECAVSWIVISLSDSACSFGNESLKIR